MFLLTSCKIRDKNSNTNEEIKNNNCQKTCLENSRTKSLLKEIDHTNVVNKINDSLYCLTPDSNESMAYIPGGIYSMGSSNIDMALKRELPQHQVKVNAFYMDIHEVTNSQFSAFVRATNYKTVAERQIDWDIIKKQLPKNTPKPNSDLLQPGSMVFVSSKDIYNLIDISQWWRWIKGADWQHPYGPESNIKGKGQELSLIHI